MVAVLGGGSAAIQESDSRGQAAGQETSGKAARVPAVLCVVYVHVVLIVCMHVYVRACARVRLCACLCVCPHMSVRVCTCVSMCVGCGRV